MNIAIGTDHAGYHLKESLKRHLKMRGHQVRDFGTNSDAAVDYPDFIRPAAQSVAKGESELGIVLGGSGNGEAMVANKVKGIRCALCWNEETAHLGHLGKAQLGQASSGHHLRCQPGHGHTGGLAHKGHGA